MFLTTIVCPSAHRSARRYDCFLSPLTLRFIFPFAPRVFNRPRRVFRSDFDSCVCRRCARKLANATKSLWRGVRVSPNPTERRTQKERCAAPVVSTRRRRRRRRLEVSQSMLPSAALNAGIINCLHAAHRRFFSICRFCCYAHTTNSSYECRDARSADTRFARRSCTRSPPLCGKRKRKYVYRSRRPAPRRFSIGFITCLF